MLGVRYLKSCYCPCLSVEDQVVLLSALRFPKACYSLPHGMACACVCVLGEGPASVMHSSIFVLFTPLCIVTLAPITDTPPNLRGFPQLKWIFCSHGFQCGCSGGRRPSKCSPRDPGSFLSRTLECSLLSQWLGERVKDDGGGP